MFLNLDEKLTRLELAPYNLKARETWGKARET